MENLVYGQIVRADNGADSANLNIALFDIDTNVAALLEGYYNGNGALSDFIDSQPASNSPQTIQEMLTMIFGPTREEDGELRGDDRATPHQLLGAALLSCSDGVDDRHQSLGINAHLEYRDFLQ